MMTHLRMVGCLMFVWMALSPDGFALSRDLVKETQSDVVAVTQELLTRESEPGPASPTFKMSDTSGFMVKKPFSLLQNEEFLTIQDEPLNPDFEGWFDWDESAGTESTEPIEEKELR